MENKNNNYNSFVNNEFIEFIISSFIGDRNEQQDSACYECDGESAVITVCDGMGGYSDGAAASTLAAKTVCESCKGLKNPELAREKYIESVYLADEKIHSFKDENGEPTVSGTTVVSAYLYKNMLQWISVGDSRIYIFHNGKMAQITDDHNYEMLLTHQLNVGEISEEIFENEMQEGHKLISFLGMGGIDYIDFNSQIMNMQSNDIMLLTTDGLYKLLSDEEIEKLLFGFRNIKDAAFALMQSAKKQAQKNGKKMDNITFAVIKIK